MVLRLLIIALAVAAVLWLLRTKRSDTRDPGQAAARKRQGPGPDRMVRCAVCALHLPAADAVADGDAYYCGEAHRAAARSGRS